MDVEERMEKWEQIVGDQNGSESGDGRWQGRGWHNRRSACYANPPLSVIEIENSKKGSQGRKLGMEKWEEMVGDENGKVGVNEVRGGFEWEEQSQLGRG